MALLNIPFADGNKLINYQDDMYYTPGCPTCDYGAEHINDISVITTHYVVEIEFNEMYRYAISANDVIRIFALPDYGTMTEYDFLKYIEREFKSIATPTKFKVEKRH